MPDRRVKAGDGVGVGRVKLGRDTVGDHAQSAPGVRGDRRLGPLGPVVEERRRVVALGREDPYLRAGAGCLRRADRGQQGVADVGRVSPSLVDEH